MSTWTAEDRSVVAALRLREPRRRTLASARREPSRRAPPSHLLLGLVVAISLATAGASALEGAAGASTAPSHQLRPIAHLYVSRSAVPARGAVIVLRLRTVRATRCRFIAAAPVEVVRRWIGCRDGLVRTVARFHANTGPHAVRRRMSAWVTGPGGRFDVAVTVVEAGAPDRPRPAPPTPTPPPASPAASLSLSPSSLSAAGGAFVLTYSSENASTCSLAASPALWSGANPATVSCSGSYQGSVPSTATGARQWTFTFTAESATGQSASSSQVLTEQASPLSVTTSSLPGATVGTAYAAGLAAAGGTPPYSWAVSSGSLPAGLALSSNGAITGTPTAAGSVSLTVQVSDSGTPTPQVATATLSISVLVPPYAGQTSTNWSGFVVPSSTDLITEVSGEWTVPALDCAATPNAGASTWVGIGGVSWSTGGTSGALLQTGVTTNCVGGVQQDVGWWEEVPSSPNHEVDFTGFSVSPGDTIQASVFQGSSGAWETRVDDFTTGLSGVMVTGEGWGVASDASSGTFPEQGSTVGLSYGGGYTAEWIVEDYALSGALVAFADYGAVSFSGLTTSLPSWSLTPSEAMEIVQGGAVVSTPSAPSSDAFSVSYTG